MNPAKKYLLEVEKEYISLRQKEAQMRNLQEIMYMTGGIDYSKERVQTSPTANAAYETKVEMFVDLAREIEQEQAQFNSLVVKVTKQIQTLEDEKKKDILFKRYIQHKPLWVAAEEMNYSFNYIRRLHSEALNDFQKRWL